jgi:hypothetical protein
MYAILGNQNQAGTHSSMVNVDSHCAYGVQKIWEGQRWIVKAFHKLTAKIGKGVPGTLSSTMQNDSIREAAKPPAGAEVDRRTKPHFVRMQTGTHNHPCKSVACLCLFVCNHIVFSHVVAMTNYLLPSPPVQNTSLMGRIPRPPKYYKKNIQIKENKNEEQKDNTI